MAVADRACTSRFVITDRALRATIKAGPAPNLPGCFVERGGRAIHAPENAAALLRERLSAAGVPFVEERRGIRPALSWTDILNRGELNELAVESIERLAYQKAGIIFSANRVGALLAHATGSGKTLTALAWALATPGPIIYSTKSGARGTVHAELKLWLRPHVTYEILEGLTGAPLRRDVRIYVVGAETLAAWVDYLIALEPVSLILDEVHYFQNEKRYCKPVILNEETVLQIRRGDRKLAQGEFYKQDDATGSWLLFAPKKNRASAAAKLARVAKRRLALSATPIPDRVRNLWSVLDCIEPESWGRSALWLDRYAARKPGAFGGFEAKGAINQDELKARLDVVAHIVTKAEANKDLPPLRRRVIRLKPDELDNPSGGFAAALKKCQNIQQRLEVELQRTASMKRSFVVKQLVLPAVEAKHKILVLTGRRRDAEVLADAIEAAGAGVLVRSQNLWMGHGEHSDRERDAMRDAYMASPQGPSVLVGTVDSWGEHYNLQRSDQLILPMLPSTPRLALQAEGRISRRGQDRPALVTYVVAEGTVDEAAAVRLLQKLPAIERLVDDTEARGILEALRGTQEEIIADVVSCIQKGLDSDRELERLAEQVAAQGAAADRLDDGAGGSGGGAAGGATSE